MTWMQSQCSERGDINNWSTYQLRKALIMRQDRRKDREQVNSSTSKLEVKKCR